MTSTREAAERYLDLLRGVLTRELFLDEQWAPVDHRQYAERGGIKWRVLRPALDRLADQGIVLARHPYRSEAKRREIRQLIEVGQGIVDTAETMIGIRRLDDLRTCIRTVIDEGVPGDLIETGVWRGGASIFMRAALEAYGDPDRQVWVADSFQGLPAPDAERYPADEGSVWHLSELLAVDEAAVRANFERYGLLDDRVRFLPGWFRDTLATAPIEQLAVARLDGDLYESTMDALDALYPKVAVGGFVIIDDWNIDTCRKAVEDYRAEHAIDDEIVDVDGWCVRWRRTK